MALPGRNNAALDTEAPQEQLSQGAPCLHAQRFVAMIEANIHTRTKVFSMGFRRQVDFYFKHSLQSCAAIFIRRAYGKDTAPCNTQCCRWLLMSTSVNFTQHLRGK